MKNIIAKIIQWWNTPKNSIFRVVDRPTLFVKSVERNGSTWLVTYIRCDECSKKTEEAVFDYSDRKWKCSNCSVEML